MSAVINNSRETLRLVGTALSPEYVAVVPPGELIPSDERFGVFWMGYDELAAAFDLDGAFNDVALDLAPGASEPEVIRQLDRLLAPYGGLGAYGRDDQLSHQFVSEELKQLRSTGTVAPMIFLAVAAFLLNVVLNRVINTQREQIGALKAFGYGRLELATHYMKLALLISGAGAIAGSAAGAWLAKGLTALYAQFYHFPSFEIQLDVRTIALAFAVSIGAAVFGVAGAVRRVAHLPPAAAMRPEPPASFRPTIVERAGLQRFFAQTTRMILRQLERRPFKSFGAAVIMILTGLISLRDAYRAIEWPILVLLGALIPVAQALERSGGAEIIALNVLQISHWMPPEGILVTVLVATMFLSDLVNNAAAAVLMAPIAISVAEGIGASADPFLMSVAVGASCAFLTPIGHQSNTLVMGPGGYRFGDYWRMGLALEVVIAAVGIPLILWFWPLGL